MKIFVQCVCGARLSAPSEAIGGTVACPSCRTALFVPSDDATSKILREGGEAKAWVCKACECGRLVPEPPSWAGRATRCPWCQRELMMPRPAKSESIAVLPADPYVEDRSLRGSAQEAWSARSQLLTELDEEVEPLVEPEPEPGSKASGQWVPLGSASAREPGEAEPPRPRPRGLSPIDAVQVAARQRRDANNGQAASPQGGSLTPLVTDVVGHPSDSSSSASVEDESAVAQAPGLLSEAPAASVASGEPIGVSALEAGSSTSARDADASSPSATPGAPTRTSASVKPVRGARRLPPPRKRRRRWRRRASVVWWRGAASVIWRRPFWSLGTAGSVVLGLIVALLVVDGPAPAAPPVLPAALTQDAYYFDADSGTIFRHPGVDLSPVDTPWQDHPPPRGYRAFVFSCRSCNPHQWEVFYIERYSEQARRAWREHLASGAASEHSAPSPVHGRFIADPRTMEWVPIASPQALALIARPEQKRCPDGGSPRPCTPEDR